MPFRQCAQIAWSPKRRYCIDLHAHGVGTADRYAGLFQNWCHPFHRGMYAENIRKKNRKNLTKATFSVPQFAGFSSDSLADRINDCKAKILITCDGAWRGEKLLELKAICDEALEKAAAKGHRVSKCVVVAHLKRVTPGSEEAAQSVKPAPFDDERDVWWHEEMEDAEPACYPQWMAAEEPLFMLYTSGSTGKPKGVLHTTAGYLLYGATTFKMVFDYKPGDIYWCTADIGWITGHTYVVYGPLANGATSVMFEGTPFYPENDRYWQIVDKYKVNQLYTAPTAIRALMKFGTEPVLKHDLKSLR